MIYFFTVLIVIDTAHNLSPMAMAWSRGDFRAVMLRQWVRYIALPLAVLAVSLAAATQSRTAVDTVVNIYFAWNVWHFASQNYGLLRLWQMRRIVRCQRRAEPCDRRLFGRPILAARLWATTREAPRWQPDWPFCMAVTIVGMVVWPMLASDPWTWRLINLAIFAIPHWVSEIFLTSWASTRWKVFAPLILAAGCLGLLWVTPRATGMPVVGVWWVCWRCGLGFVHFIFDGQLWRFSNPEVRATIWRTLFGLPAMRATIGKTLFAA